MISLRKEIQDFAGSCEKLLSHCMTPGNNPLSEDERQLIIYYLDELRGLVTTIKTS